MPFCFVVWLEPIAAVLRAQKDKAAVGSTHATAKGQRKTAAATSASGKKAAALAEAAAAEELPASPPEADGPRGTLLVCPLSVLSNWAAQLQDHTQEKLSVRSSAEMFEATVLFAPKST